MSRGVSFRAHEAHDRRFADGQGFDIAGAWLHWAGNEDDASPVRRQRGRAPGRRDGKASSVRGSVVAVHLPAVPWAGAAAPPARQPARLWQVRQGERIDLSFAVGAHREAPSGHSASSSRHAQQRQAIACPCSGGPDVRRASQHRVRVAAIADRRAQTWR
jgi:hypothetical protein